jgi:EF-P beta-lysylation protein EpmB
MSKVLPLQSLPDWQQELSQAVSSVAQLCKELNLDPADFPSKNNFPLRIPRPYLNRIKKGDRNDPLLLQAMPQVQEALDAEGYSKDPLGETNVNPVPGLLHKYAGRVLLITTSSCAIHCRYCFRRHFPYAENRPGREKWQKALDYIQNDVTVTEVILSGGDPLAASNKYLAWLLQALAEIPHLQRIRFHTRLPVMIPSRIDSGLVKLLQPWHDRGVIVLHSNHAQEFDSEVDNALKRLSNCGFLLLNQSVLLRGINDTVNEQKALSLRLFQAGVLPYYLFLLDKVAGAAHFDVSISDAKQLILELRSLLPGYLVPKLTCEIAGQESKLPL